MLKNRIKLGCDIGGGGDYNVYVLRFGPFAIVAGKNQSDNTMVNVSEIERLQKEWGIEWRDISIDDIGIGRGVADRFREKGLPVNSVNVGSSAIHKDTFANLKAELYWDMGAWVRGEDVRFDKNDNWIQILLIMYSLTS
jgi:hypothetical protein